MANNLIPYEIEMENRKLSIKTEIGESKRLILPDFVEAKRKLFKCSKMLVLDILNDLVKEGFILIDRKEGVIQLNDGLKSNPLKEVFKPEDICGLCGFEILETRIKVKEGVSIHAGCFQAMKPDDWKNLVNK